jgi:hypothetical protein
MQSKCLEHLLGSVHNGKIVLKNFSFYVVHLSNLISEFNVYQFVHVLVKGLQQWFQDVHIQNLRDPWTSGWSLKVTIASIQLGMDHVCSEQYQSRYSNRIC